MKDSVTPAIKNYMIDAFQERKQKQNIKKYYNKGTAIYTLHCRCNNTAFSCIELLQDIEPKQLSMALYLMIRDSGFSLFASKYEAMLELSKTDADSFVDRLYPFYSEMAKTIKSTEGFYHAFFDLLRYFVEDFSKQQNEKVKLVYRAYINLLLNQVEFLRKNPFEINNMIAGITTDGDPIEIQDPFPNYDVAGNELTKYLLENNNIKDAKATALRIFAKYGFKLPDIEMLEVFRVRQQIYTNNISLLAGYIDEHTVDIIPDCPFVEKVLPDELPRVKISTEHLKELLKHRRRTLPAGGIKITFNSQFFVNILLKEIYRDDSVILLFRVNTVDGDTSGFYNTRTGYTHTVFSNLINSKLPLHEILESVILWAYAAYVTNDESVELTGENYASYFDEPMNGPVEVTYEVFGNKYIAHPASKNFRTLIGDENYTTETRQITGYIRKLPEGSKASETARALAEELGYELDDNETFVKPFERVS